MAREETSIIAALRREPEQTARLFKFSAVTAIAMVVWDVMAGWVVPDVAVKVGMVLILLAYGTLMAYLMARLMGSSREWATGSAAAANKLTTPKRDRPEPARPIDLESLRRRPDELPPVPQELEFAPVELREPAGPSHAMDAIAFNESYFLMRLQEEVKNARRVGHEMCVAAVHVTIPGGEMTPELGQSVAYDMARIASSQSRLMSQPLALSDGEFVFSLPDTGPNDSKQFVREIMRAFGDYWCFFGIAAFPRNATDAVTLVERARAACEMSLQSGKRGQVEYSAA